jgi:hypothetical protein
VDELPWLTHADFNGLRGDRFVLRVDEATTVDLELVGTRESTQLGGRGPQGQERLQFTVTFRGPGEPLLEQGIRDLQHDGLGALGLFLVPVARDGDGILYEAAFA